MYGRCDILSRVVVKQGALIVLAAVMGGAPLYGQEAPEQAPAIAVIPQPVAVTPQQGHFTITRDTTIWTDRASVRVGRQLAQDLELPTGFIFHVRLGQPTRGHAIRLVRDPSLTRLGPEGYLLTVTRSRVLIRAPEEAGLFYGVQTLRQLLPPDIFREAPLPGAVWTVPAVTIEDYPRFRWRGAHLDVSRHFMPKAFVKKFIDLLALYKLNTFHWHLTDDQGWRLEIKQYPRLTSVGAWRTQTIVGRQPSDPSHWTFDGTPHGGFYTQDDAREIVAYAKARFITVVPEIEMPGHSVAAIAAYPDLGVTGQPLEVATHWGVFSDILNAKPSTVEFMQNVLTEVMAIFPSRYIHVGGDEADKAKWKVSPAIQARIRDLNLKDEDELQSWFIRQMDGFLTAHGRRLVGWDEILQGGLAENAVVMSWRGTAGGVAAARAGHDVVMAPTSHTYLDYAQSSGPGEPAGQSAVLPLQTVYDYEPVPADLEPQYAAHVLGAQAQIWTEYMPDPKRVEYMAFPRLTALAEVVWTPPDRKDYAGYLARVTIDLQRLQRLDVNFRPLTPANPEQSSQAR